MLIFKKMRWDKSLFIVAWYMDVRLTFPQRWMASLSKHLSVQFGSFQCSILLFHCSDCTKPKPDQYSEDCEFDKIKVVPYTERH